MLVPRPDFPDANDPVDLKSGMPFWGIKNGFLRTYPALQEDVDCDVLIVGGGITGALIARDMLAAGQRTVVIDRREIGWGSTSASTALLQYEIDTEMGDLAERLGEDNAALAYRACEDAIGTIRRIAGGFRGVECFPLRSLYYASRRSHAPRLRDELVLRRKHGIRLSLLEREALQERFGFDAPVALLSERAAAVDPYQLTHALLQAGKRRGLGVFARTEMFGFQTRRGGVVARVAGRVVRCRHLVFASGYEARNHLRQRVARNHSSYAYVTDPQSQPLGPLADTMVWESARPYLYMRRTRDGRLLVGGEDDAVDFAPKRDALLPKKVHALRRKAEALFPQFDWQPAFSWAGTFAETEDGLPFFGAHEEHGPRVLFAMAYGGNGITYSTIGAGLLAAQVTGQKHPLARLFSFDRIG